MGFHEQPAHHTSVFGPKAWVPGAGLHLQGHAAAAAGLRRTVGDITRGSPLRPAARGSWFSMLASAFRGAPSPWKVSADPGGDIIRRSPPGRAGAMLARLRGPRAPTLEYLHTLRQDRLFDWFKGRATSALITGDARRSKRGGVHLSGRRRACLAMAESAMKRRFSTLRAWPGKFL